MHRQQKGFAHPALIIFLVVLLGVVGVGFRVYSSKKDSNSTEGTTNTTNTTNTGTSSTAKTSKCKAATAGVFTHDVTEISNVNLIQTPIRLVGGSNIKTHSFIDVSKKSPVYAPMDATLNGGANYYETMGTNPVTKVQYILAFNNGCDLNYWLDHLVDVPEKIKSAFPVEPQNNTQAVNVKETKVKAGELLGYSNQEGSARFDFGAVNLKGSLSSLTTNPKFKDDPIVKTSDKYRYPTCPYNLYNTAKQKVYQSLYDPSTTGDQQIIDNICD